MMRSLIPDSLTEIWLRKNASVARTVTIQKLRDDGSVTTETARIIKIIRGGIRVATETMDRQGIAFRFSGEPFCNSLSAIIAMPQGALQSIQNPPEKGKSLGW